MTAVLICHDGARYLPQVLAGLNAQDRPPDRRCAVDTASVDGTPTLLAEELGPAAVLRLPRQTAFGAALGAAVAALPPSDAGIVEWIWILHDDSAPEPGALRALLELAEQHPEAGLIGPKVRSWNGRFLLELGLAPDRTGRLDRGVERHEVDQGQHDQVREVLAVGSAGALVRRDVFEALAGYDPALPLFGDDVDFGWRVVRSGFRVLVAPQAAIRHAAALAAGRRDPALGRRERLIRRAAFYPWLVNAPIPVLCLLVPRWLAGSTLRAVGLLLLRRPRAAAAELTALPGLLARAPSLRAARRRRRVAAEIGYARVRPLLAGPAFRLRAYRDAVNLLAAGGLGRARRSGWRSSRVGLLVVVGLTTLSLVGDRALVGSAIAGGRLLPAPNGASAVWRSYLAAFHPTGLGSGAPAPPMLAVLAALATVLFGKPWLAVNLLLFGALPLAGLSAYLCARRLVGSALLAGWGAATWALLPLVTGGVAGGRLDATITAIALPPLALGFSQVLAEHPATAGWWRAFALGGALAAATAFAPLLYPVAVLAVLLAVGLGFLRRWRGRAWSPASALAAAVALAVPWAVLGPWTGYLLAHPGLLLAAPGLADPGSAQVPAYRLLLADPGGPGAPPAWLLLPLLGGALAALLQRGRRVLTGLAWFAILIGYGGALWLDRLTLAVSGARFTPWPAVPVAVGELGLVAGCLLAASSLRGQLTSRAFGWRHLSAGLLVAAGAAVPGALGVAWLAGGPGAELHPVAPPATPAFVVAEAGAEHRRVLAMDVTAAGNVGYAVLPGGQPPTLGTENLMGAYADPALGPAVAALVSGTGTGYAAALAEADIGFLQVAGSAARPVRARLAGEPDLLRLTDEGSWALALPTSAVRVAAGPGVAGLPLEANAELPAGPSGRLLVLATGWSSNWRAQLSGRRLRPARAYGWAQAFRLPASGGRVRVSYSAADRDRWLVAQLIALILLGVLAVPGRARQPRAEDV